MNRDGIFKVFMGEEPKFVPTSDDPLVEFVHWYCRQSPGKLPAPPENALSWVGGLASVTLYRAGPFQVQLFIFPAGTEVKEHRHPNVDSVEMHVSGDLDFRVNGVSALPVEMTTEFRHGELRSRGVGLRLRPSDWHGGTVGPAGAAFMSFQHWLNGKPGYIGADWEGEPQNPAHAVMLT